MPKRGQKIGHKPDHVNSVIKLLDHGEERLVAAVETGQMPVVLAMDIAMLPADEQRAIQEAYESTQLSGHKLMAVRRLLENRRCHGKALYSRKCNTNGPRNLSANDVLKAYKREVDHKRLLARKADAVNTRLLFIIEAMSKKPSETHDIKISFESDTIRVPLSKITPLKLISPTVRDSEKF